MKKVAVIGGIIAAIVIGVGVTTTLVYVPQDDMGNGQQSGTSVGDEVEVEISKKATETEEEKGRDLAIELEERLSMETEP